MPILEKSHKRRQITVEQTFRYRVSKIGPSQATAPLSPLRLSTHFVGAPYWAGANAKYPLRTCTFMPSLHSTVTCRNVPSSFKFEGV